MTYIKRLLMALTILTICGCENKKVDEHEQLEVERLSKILKEKREDVLAKLELENDWLSVFAGKHQQFMAELIDDAIESKSRTKMVVLLSEIKQYEWKCRCRETTYKLYVDANAANRKEEAVKHKADFELKNIEISEMFLPLWNRYLKEHEKHCCCR